LSYRYDDTLKRKWDHTPPRNGSRWLVDIKPWFQIYSRVPFTVINTLLRHM